MNFKEWLCAATALIAAGAAPLRAQTTNNLNGLQPILGFSQLPGSAAGVSVLTGNLSTAISINNTSNATQRAQAISDNTIASLLGTVSNGMSVADGLGSKLSTVFLRANSVNPTTFADTTFSTNLKNLMQQATSIVLSDNGVAKNLFANGTSNGKTPSTSFVLPAGGFLNAYDAVNKPAAGSANTVGDSRPFQVAPSQIQSFSAPDFFGVSTNSATAILPTLGGNASFPSGHSATAFSASTLLALMVPERFQELVTRGSEFGNSRIVLGVHYPLDVIGARIQTYYALTQVLNNNPAYTNIAVPLLLGGSVTSTSDFQALFNSARTDLQGLLSTGCGASVATCAATNATDRFSNKAQDKADFIYRLTYGLPAVGPVNLAPVVPAGAEALIATRFPYLSAAQRRDVLASTEIASGQALDDGSGWARLNLYSAADGYGALSGAVAVTLNAAQGGFSAADSWNNDIGGSGGLTLNGTGQLFMTGNNTFTGPVTVAGGTLSVNGAMTAPITVTAGGTLRGAGLLRGATTIASGGRLAPGNSPGTLIVNAPLTLQAGAVSQFDIDGTGTGNGAGNYSRIIVTGAGNGFAAAGALLPQLRGITGDATNSFTPQLGQQFLIVAAQGGVTGSYDGLTQPTTLPANTRFDAAYGPNSVTLVVTPSSYANLGVFGIALTANERAAAVGLDGGRPAAGVAGSGAQARLYGTLYTLPTVALEPTLAQLSPSVYGDSAMVWRDNFGAVGSVIAGELESRRGALPGLQANQVAQGKTTVWLSGLGQFTSVDNGAAPGFTSSTGGMVAGVDTLADANIRLGGALGYSSQSVTTRNGASATGDALHLNVYGSTSLGRGFIDVQGGAAFTEGTARRSIAAYGVQTKGDTSGRAYGGSIRAGVDLDVAGITLEPSASLLGVRVDQDSLTESQAGAAGLNVNGIGLSSLRTLLAVRAETRIPLGGGLTVAPSLQVGWAHEMLDTRASISTGFTGVGGSGFTVGSATVGRDAAIIGLRGNLETGGPFSAYVSYQGSFTSRSDSQTVAGGIRYTW